MKTATVLLMTAMVFLLQACEKEKDEPAENETPVKKALLRSIDWDNGTKAVMNYNPDSTLNKIVYTLGNTTSTTVFTWQHKQLQQMFDDRSIYANNYYYDGGNVSHYINRFRTGTSPTSYKMEYTYGANGAVTNLKWLASNEAGTIVKSTSTYHYNAAGELTKVVTLNGNAVYTHIIEAYSDSVDFDPLVFIDPSLSENYPLFNLPVLSRMNKYPAKIVRNVKLGNDAAYTDKIDENICSIVNKRINKMVTTITIPGMPQYRSETAAVFRY